MNYTKRMEIIKLMGFTTVFSNVEKYPQDGIVYRFDDYKKCSKLGYTAKYPRFAIALKPRGVVTATTHLQAVEWAVGRTGTVNPTGIIEPVVLDDATITRVTLHNIGIIEQNNLGIGDLIEVERAGGVIPKFIKVIQHSLHDQKITKEHAEEYIGVKTKRQGPRLVLVDKNHVNTKLLEHFVKTMEIKGLGPASINKLGLLHPTDLFQNQDWQLLGVNGIKVYEEIKKAKSKPYETVLAALGIPGVGKSAAKLIVSRLPTFDKLKDINYLEIKGIGPATKQSIIDWLEENYDWASSLPLNLSTTVTVDDLILTKRKVCITGKLDMTRSDLADILEKKDFIVSNTVTKDCYALITGDTKSSKYDKAVKYGIKIIDYWSNKVSIVNGNF